MKIDMKYKYGDELYIIHLRRITKGTIVNIKVTKEYKIQYILIPCVDKDSNLYGGDFHSINYEYDMYETKKEAKKAWMKMFPKDKFNEKTFVRCLEE